MDIALIVTRFVHLATTMTLFGTSFFAAVLAPASLTDDLRPLLRRLTLPLALLMLASAAAWLVLVTRSMAGDADLESIHDVLTGSAFATFNPNPRP
jgi:putative copper resistance protein D